MSSVQKNPMVAVVVYEAYSKGTTLREVVLHAAVHGWYEGHAEGEDEPSPSGELQRRPVDGAAPAGPGAEVEMPSPPYPDPQDAALAGIIANTLELFTSMDLAPAAAAYAAGLAYAAGVAEGRACAGCVARGSSRQVAAEVRAGVRGVRFVNGVAELAGNAKGNPESAIHLELGRRLLAAYLSYQMGNRTIDYTFRNLKERDVGPLWIDLAAEVAERAGRAIGAALGEPSNR